MSESNAALRLVGTDEAAEGPHHWARLSVVALATCFRTLSDRAKLVLAAIVANLDGDDRCRLTNVELSVACGHAGVGYGCRGVAELLSTGWITCEEDRAVLSHRAIAITFNLKTRGQGAPNLASTLHKSGQVASSDAPRLLSSGAQAPNHGRAGPSAPVERSLREGERKIPSDRSGGSGRSEGRTVRPPTGIEIGENLDLLTAEEIEFHEGVALGGERIHAAFSRLILRKHEQAMALARAQGTAPAGAVLADSPAGAVRSTVPDKPDSTKVDGVMSTGEHPR